MPLFDYACSKCQHTFEALQKVNAEPLVECPVCHAMALEQQIGTAAFRLKGSGWYESDFKTANQKNLLKSDSE